MMEDKLQQRYRAQIRKVEELFSELYPLFEQKRPLDQNLKRIFRDNPKLGSKDRRLIGNAIFGFFRWYGWLKPLMEDQLNLALLLGYLLDANEITPTVGFWSETCGLFENVLVNLAKIPADESELLNRKKWVQSLSENASSIEQLFPDWLPSLQPQQLIAIQKRPPVWLRLRKTSLNDFFSQLETKRVTYNREATIPNAIRIASPINLSEYRAFREGAMEVQDISSQGVGLTANPTSGENWWDVCAGAGGKSLHLADLMQGKGEVISTDIREKSLVNLEKRAKTAKLKNITISHWDGETPPFGDREFDGVLVDAPCSGSGTWRRNPALRWYYSVQELQHFSELQLKILQLASKYVRLQGSLVYSTCSLIPQEKQKVVNQFLRDNPRFSVVADPNPLTGEADKGFHQFGPPELDGDYMFAVRLRRER